jgi:hypothetical protein
MSYNTDKDLRGQLFETFERADDGSPISLPHHIPDTIQPIIDLQNASALLNTLTVERDQAVTAFPTQTSGNLVVPANERWLIWRLVGFCSDPAPRICHIRLEGGGAQLAVTDGLALPVNVPVVARGPFIANPTEVMDCFADAVLAAGSLSIDAVFTRFQLGETIPMVPAIF